MVPNIPTQIALFDTDHLIVLTQMVSNISNWNRFICMEWDGFKDRYVILIIQFSYTINEFQV